MPLLLLLNGPPGIGKTTVAAAYVAQHPLALCLDVDRVRRQLGLWAQHPEESGLRARDLALAMAEVHLRQGLDVVVPQYVVRQEFVDGLAAVAGRMGARFVHVALIDDEDAVLARFAARADDPALAQHHREAVDQLGGTAALRAMHRRLLGYLAEHPEVVVVRSRAGAVETSVRAVLAAL